MGGGDGTRRATMLRSVGHRWGRPAAGIARAVALGSAVALLAWAVLRGPGVDAADEFDASVKPATFARHVRLADDPTPPIIPGRLVIKYRDGGQETAEGGVRSAAVIDAVLQHHTGGGALSRRALLPKIDPDRAPESLRAQLRERLQRRRRRELAGIELVTVPVTTDLTALCRELAARPEVAWAHPDYLFPFGLVPNDPYYHSADSWGQGYDDLYGPKLLDCQAAWDLAQGQGAVVAVVDSGVDYAHPDLAANVWVNALEDINGNGQFDNWPADQSQGGVSGDLDGADNDGNGYLDDVVGYDFAGDGLTPDADPMDTLGHGTHVAGTIAAVGDNSLGVIGVAPQAHLMALKVGVDGSGGVSVFAAAEAVVYLADQGARVANYSWGGILDLPELRDAFQYAAEAGVASVASAGNANAYASFYFPVSYPSVIGVAATDHNDRRAPFSNYGPAIEVCAPGGGESEPAGLDRPDYSILSLLAEGSVMAGWPYVVGDGYLRLGGTSMAAPHVSGVAALLVGAYPGIGVQEVRGRLKVGAEPVDQVNPDYAGLLGAGRVNAHQALIADPQPYLELTEITTQGPVAPGCTFDLMVAIRNEWIDAHNAALMLSSAHPLVEVVQPAASLGDIVGGQTADNAQDPFVVRLDPGAAWGQTLPFALTCQYDEGVSTFDFSINILIFQEVISRTRLPVSGPSSITLGLQDLDGDDYPDALVSWALSSFQLFANQQDGTFAPVPLPLEVHSVRGLRTVDLNDDGFRDIIAPGNVFDGPDYGYIYRHLGNMRFETAPYDAELEDPPGATTLALDLDHDRLLDLFLLGNTGLLLRNEGGFSFSDVSGRLPSGPISAGSFLDAVLTDYDNDGHADLVIAGGSRGLKLLRNLGDGTYEDATAGAGIPSVTAWDLAVGDFDNDGLVDVFVGDYKPSDYTGSAPANRLLHNDGDGTFTDLTAQSGDLYQDDPANRPAAYGGSECFDYDNDGDLDIFVQCGDNPADPSARLYRNNGDGTFADVTDQTITLPPGVRYTAAYGDYDNDGDLDIYLSDSPYGAAGFLRNYATSLPQANHWIKVRLFGIDSNREAFGARVTVVSGGLRQIREVTHSDRATQPLHFGLGTHDRVDVITVRWPSGTRQYHSDLAVDQTVTLIEGEGSFCGDIDGDGGVNLSDFATFALCFSGGDDTGRPPGCSEAAWILSDCDGDGDVDLRDFATFAADFNGAGGHLDCNGNALPDECDLDCGPPDGPCQIPGCGQGGDCNANGIPDECELYEDCNGNGVQDLCDIAGGTSQDLNGNDLPDECEVPWRLVDAGAPNGGAGLSWATAYNDLQEALEAAAYYESVITEIWVAAGTYRPDRATGDRSASFALLNGLAVYGGLAGTEDPATFDLTERDFQANETFLSGDLGANDGPDWAHNDENSFHVVTGSGTDASAVLDGFTITAGHADGAGNPSHDDSGAGMLNLAGSPTLRNCTFLGNFADGDGGGMYNHDRSNPALTDCTFSGNQAYNGGGMHNWMSSPTLTGCTLSGNSAYDGGGMYNLRSNSPALTDCAFHGNSASDRGGGMLNEFDNSPTLRHCVFSDNEAVEGAGIYEIHSNHSTLIDCCFRGNSAQGIGGGMFVFYNNNATLANCTFAGNTAPAGPALASDTYPGWAANTLDLTNCILWDGGGEVWNNDGSAMTIIYSDVQGGWPGQGNIDADPLFVAGPAGAYYLSQPAAGDPQPSPCVNAGLGSPGDWHVETRTTRRDQVLDTQAVDLGYHYPVIGDQEEPLPRSESVQRR